MEPARLTGRLDRRYSRMRTYRELNEKTPKESEMTRLTMAACLLPETSRRQVAYVVACGAERASVRACVEVQW